MRNVISMRSWKGRDFMLESGSSLRPISSASLSEPHFHCFHPNPSALRPTPFSYIIPPITDVSVAFVCVFPFICVGIEIGATCLIFLSCFDNHCNFQSGIKIQKEQYQVFFFHLLEEKIALDLNHSRNKQKNSLGFKLSWKKKTLPSVPSFER